MLVERTLKAVQRGHSSSRAWLICRTVLRALALIEAPRWLAQLIEALRQARALSRRGRKLAIRCELRQSARLFRRVNHQALSRGVRRVGVSELRDERAGDACHEARRRIVVANHRAIPRDRVVIRVVTRAFTASRRKHDARHTRVAPERDVIASTAKIAVTWASGVVASPHVKRSAVAVRPGRRRDRLIDARTKRW